MGSSRQTKKERKNKSRAARRKMNIKNQSFQPVLKSIDIEEIKASFAKKPASKVDSKKPEATPSK